MTIRGSVIFDESGRYRYMLERSWERRGTVTFVMLNPSSADATRDDPTLRRCIGFAQRWGVGRLLVVNLFALRSSEPRTLRQARDPVGPRNDEFIRGACEEADLVVGAWGNHGRLTRRDEAVISLIEQMGIRLTCLGLTSIGSPRHPLYAASSTPLVQMHRDATVRFEAANCGPPARRQARGTQRVNFPPNLPICR
jgi:hypothetical protein